MGGHDGVDRNRSKECGKRAKTIIISVTEEWLRSLNWFFLSVPKNQELNPKIHKSILTINGSHK